MHRDSADVSAAARQRLELLGRELGRTLDEPEQPTVTLAAAVVPEPGRHALESRGAGSGLRLPGWLTTVRDRLAWTPAHLGVIALLAATALAIVAWVALHAAPQEIAAPVASRIDGPTASAAPALATSTAAASATTQTTEVVIDVAGKVRRPGVATLPAGSRVVDAIRHAGGARRGVDLSSLNLARVLVDGEQILVGATAAPGRAASAAAPAAGSTLVNLNSATAEELDGLPGVGPVTASKIIDWRSQHGAFTAVDELLEVDGIGTKTLADLAPHVTL